MIIAIIAAAGRGTRLGAGRAKQFLELAGQPVLVHTLRRVASCSDIGEIIVVLPADEMSSYASLLPSVRPSVRVVRGGQERQESVFHALQVINPHTVEIVLVHDAVRPFVTVREMVRVIAAARESGAALVVTPVRDTIKEVEGDRVVRTLDRRRLYLAQTPQAFRTDILIEAHQRARREGIVATDDAALVERCGYPVVIVEGSPYNIKITWPEDLLLADAIFHVQGEG